VATFLFIERKRKDSVFSNLKSLPFNHQHLLLLMLEEIWKGRTDTSPPTHSKAVDPMLEVCIGCSAFRNLCSDLISFLFLFFFIEDYKLEEEEEHSLRE